MGYNRYLGQHEIFDAELWGILDGLVLLQGLGYQRVMIQSEVVKYLRHVSREDHQATDCIVKMALDGKEGL
ncbi:hypothetical protein Gogos_007873, partial [Gossypium gossypioides]|nr:hypothetical protein [Gossypium gossypioides]